MTAERKAANAAWKKLVKARKEHKANRNKATWIITATALDRAFEAYDAAYAEWMKLPDSDRRDDLELTV